MTSRRLSFFLAAIVAALIVTPVQSETVRLIGAFGESVFNPQPSVEYTSGFSTAIPANYALSFGVQASVLPFDMFGFVSWDRFWSGADYTFSNKSSVFAVGVGKSFALGQAEAGLLAGLCSYAETLDLDRTVGGRAEVENNQTGGLVGVQLVFNFFEKVDAVATYKIIVRNKSIYQGELSNGTPYTLSSSSHDHVLTFGLGVRFGGNA